MEATKDGSSSFELSIQYSYVRIMASMFHYAQLPELCSELCQHDGQSCP